jgi:hypothetical protein
MLTVEQMAVSFTSTHGLRFKTSKWAIQHDAVHHLAGLGASLEEEELIVSIYQPILMGNSSSLILSMVGEDKLSHVEKAVLLYEEYGHLFI